MLRTPAERRAHFAHRPGQAHQSTAHSRAAAAPHVLEGQPSLFDDLDDLRAIPEQPRDGG